MNLLFTSIEGRKHDAGMLADTTLMQDLNNHAYSTAGHPSAYMVTIQYNNLYLSTDNSSAINNGNI